MSMAFIGVVLFEAIATTRRERLGRDGQRPVQGSACRAPNPATGRGGRGPAAVGARQRRRGDQLLHDARPDRDPGRLDDAVGYWARRRDRRAQPLSDGDALAGDHLVVDPAVRLLEPVAQRDAGLPTEALEDQRVVRVAAADALGRVELVAAVELDAGDLLSDGDQ